jgi:hypothetical protein
MTEAIKESGVPVVAPKGPEPLTRSTNFTQEIAEVLPFPLPESVTGLRKLVEDPATGKAVIKDPSLDQLKFWAGVNIAVIDPKAYRTTRDKMADAAEKRLDKLLNPPLPDFSNVERALRQMDKAATVEEMDRALARYKNLAPDKAAKLDAKVNKKRILIENETRRKLERATTQAAQQ